jgi:hypothetical protein
MASSLFLDRLRQGFRRACRVLTARAAWPAVFAAAALATVLALPTKAEAHRWHGWYGPRGYVTRPYYRPYYYGPRVLPGPYWGPGPVVRVVPPPVYYYAPVLPPPVYYVPRYSPRPW